MPRSKTLISLAVAAASAFGAQAVLAGTSSPAELRGYNTCIDTTRQDSRGLVTERNYLTAASADDREYFINATRWEQGDRVAIRINCETSKSGRKLLSHSVGYGRYIDQRGNVTIEVAER